MEWKSVQYDESPYYVIAKLSAESALFASGPTCLPWALVVKGSTGLGAAEREELKSMEVILVKLKVRPREMKDFSLVIGTHTIMHTLTDSWYTGKRKTVTAMDVVYALKRQGRTLYGFGG